MVRRSATSLLAIVLAGSLALLLSGCGRAENEAGEASIEKGQPIERVETAETSGSIGTAVGQIPPSFTLKDLDGTEVSLTDFEGKVVVLDLWATWCGPCRVEIPFLVSLYNDYRDEGLVVLGVGLDRGGASVLKPFADEYDVTYPVLVADRAIQAAYQVRSIPMTLIIGRDGRIAQRHIGFRPSDGERMKAEVVTLLAAGSGEV